MQNPKIVNIINLAHGIDTRINLFDGYTPKKTDAYKGELRFWRQIVSVYGLFADCDIVQIKDRNNNLFKFMYKHSLIDKDDYEFVNSFWMDISNARKWFCHNNNTNLYYVGNKERNIEKYLKNAFGLQTNKPKTFETINSKDWGILCNDIDVRFDNYLEILKKGLETWENARNRKDLCDEWIIIFSYALWSDKELVSNVLADIALYDKINRNYNVEVSKLAKNYFEQLNNSHFSSKMIIKELEDDKTIIQSNKNIVYKGILKYGNLLR